MSMISNADMIINSYWRCNCLRLCIKQWRVIKEVRIEYNIHAIVIAFHDSSLIFIWNEVNFSFSCNSKKYWDKYLLLCRSSLFMYILLVVFFFNFSSIQIYFANKIYLIFVFSNCYVWFYSFFVILMCTVSVHSFLQYW